MESRSSEPKTWRWDAGDTQLRLEYAPPVSGAPDTGADNPDGTLTWIEEVSPEDDERGYGSRSVSSQTRSDFLQNGPLGRPPVAIVEGIVAHLTTTEPHWLGPYRLLSAVRRSDTAAARALLAQGVAPDLPIRRLTPLYEAVRLQNGVVAEQLLAAGADVNRRFPGSDAVLLMTLALYCRDAAVWEPLAAQIIARNFSAREYFAAIA